MAREDALRALMAVPAGGMLTGAELEDRAASLARRFNAVGIQADPGRFGGVVLYPTARQAMFMLAALDLLPVPEGEL